jgi:hypothetical protein
MSNIVFITTAACYLQILHLNCDSSISTHQNIMEVPAIDEKKLYNGIPKFRKDGIHPEI